MPTVGLVLPTSSYRGPDFIRAADALGIDLVVASDASLGLVSGRIVRSVAVDCADPESAAQDFLRQTDDLDLDAVVGVDDGGVMVAALAARALGLAHNDPLAVAATRDKGGMRRLLDEAGVSQPRWRAVTDLSGAVEAAWEVGYPIVIKPASLSGSRGVMRVDAATDLPDAWGRLESIRADAGVVEEPVLVEEFVSGPEVAVEGLMSPGGLEILAVFDKPDPLDGPFFEETIYVTPSRHASGVLQSVRDLVEAAVGAIGLAYGPIHAEVRLTESGPRLIEVAARSIGGLCGRSLQFGMLAQSLEVLLLRAALGMNRRGMGPVDRAAGAMMIPIPAAGTLRSVRGTEAVAEVEGVVEVTITIAPGKPLVPLPEGDRYLGFIIARADDAAAVEAALREAHDLLTVEVDPT